MQVDRSIELLRSLGSEGARWEETSEQFRNQMLTIVGDVLISAAFLAYAGDGHNYSTELQIFSD